MTTISDIKKANKEAGGFWFSPETLRFFDSIILKKVYEGPGGICFVTSEHGPHGPRAYTARQFNPDSGAIETVGEFQTSTIKEARATAREAARA